MPPTEAESASELSDWEKGEPAQRLLFRDEHNFPIGFVLHESLNEDEQQVLTNDIERNGGAVLEGVEGERGADTILINSNLGSAFRANMQLAYRAIGDPARSRIHVEFAQFIRRSIHAQRIRHSVPQIKAMGGIPAGYRRREFTSGDDEMLCWFLSRLMPDKEAGGRLGLAVYKELLACGDTMPNEYKWAKRHTAESWKERYKTHRDEFDARIEELVKEERPRKDQLWPQDRRVTHAALKRNQMDSDSEESEEEIAARVRVVESEDEGSEVEIVEIVEAPRKRRLSTTNSPSKSPNKRQRVSRPSALQVNRSQAPRTSKGKEKAVEIEDDEEQVDPKQSEFDSLFDGEVELDMPTQPEGSFRSPDRTLVASTRSNQAQPFPMTLTQTAPRNGARKVVSRPGNQAGPSNEPPTARDGPVWASPPAHSSPARPLQSSPHRPDMNSSQPPAPSATLRPPSTFQPPKRAARRRPPPVEPAVETVAEPAPYQNTRQRSRSVDPRSQVVQKSTKKRKLATAIPEEPDNEVEIVQPTRPVLRSSSRLRSLEPEALPLPQIRRRVPKKKAEPIPEEPLAETEPIEVGEILAEEMDVANLLTQEATERNPNNVTSSRRESMDTDDAHVDRRLRGESVISQVGSPTPFKFLNKPPSEILKRLESSSRRRSMLPPPSRPAPIPSQPRVAQQPSRQPRQSAPSRLSQYTFNPQTPQRQEQDRASSVESFPVSGTRARVLKDVLTQREKARTYWPPPGTRAAELNSG